MSVYRVVDAVGVDVKDAVVDDCFDSGSGKVAVVIFDGVHKAVEFCQDCILVAIGEQGGDEFQEETFKRVVHQGEYVVG